MEFLLECSTRYLKIEHSEKRTRCRSFMALNRASDMSATDWLSQTHGKYRNFSRVVIRFFSEVKVQNKALQFI